MATQIAYEEDWQDGALSEIKVGVENGETRLFLAAQPTGDGTYRLSRADQRGTTLLDGTGLELLPFAVDRLRERGYDIEAFEMAAERKSAEELFGDDTDDVYDDKEWEPEPADLREEESVDEKTHAERNAEQLAMGEEEIVGGEADPSDIDRPLREDDESETDEEYYESAEAYLEEVDEATTREIAEAIGIEDPVDVHPELAEIDEERLTSRPHPDDGRKKLYALDVDGSPPEEIDEATVVAVAEHYDTLQEVADDLEVEPLRAHAILVEHDVRDEVVWEVDGDE